jgi:hypothetical protein
VRSTGTADVRFPAEQPDSVRAVEDPAPWLLSVGGLSRSDLLAALKRSDIQLNRFAATLLDDPAFDNEVAESVQIVDRTPADLGLPNGTVLSQLFAAAQDRGLLLCPAAAGPYLRLLLTDQESAPDSVMSKGRAPSSSITVASAPLRDDHDYPKGFYLRVVDGVRWLRGYVCDDTHLWSPHDRFAFRVGDLRGHN